MVIIGGSIHGCQIAEFLIKHDKKVTIVEESYQLGAGIPVRNQYRLLEWLAKKKGSILTEVKYKEITDKGLILTTNEGKSQTIKADTILVALPSKSNLEFFKHLEGKVPEVYLIGDWYESGLILDAIADGFRVGCTV